jgi:hypothetical protein
MSIITTDVNTGAIAVTGAIKTTGTNPGAGFLAIDDTKAKLIRLADKAIMTLPVAFNDNDEITIQFGSSIIPAGAAILSVTNTQASDGTAGMAEVTSPTDNTISIDRPSGTDICRMDLTLVIDGYEDIQIERSSNLPFELTNERLNGEIFFASDVILGADFTGLQRNNDRSLVEFHFTSVLLTGTQFSCNLVRTLNGTTTNLTVTKPIGDITIVDGEFDVSWNTTNFPNLANIGLSELQFRVSEHYATIAGAGFGASQTKFDSQYIFKNEVELDLKREIVEAPTEIMGGLEDVNGFNFKEAFKAFELTSEFNELPPDNYVRLNYFTLSRTANTIYMSFRIYKSDNTLIREIAGGAFMTVNVTDWSNISQDYSIDGWRVRWNADFSFITSNTTISGLTKENASFKIPAKNLELTDNYFDESYNTLGNTVNKRDFDISRFIKNIRLIPNDKSFLTSNGEIKDFRIRYFNVSPTQYYLAFQIGTTQYTGVTVPRNTNVGTFDVEFVYPEFKVIATANWNNMDNYLFDYNALGNNSATLKKQVMLNAFTEASIQEESGATFNTKYIYADSTHKMLPYLWKGIDWSQNSKEPKTNYISFTDNNDEPESLSNVLGFLESDAAIKKAIPFGIMQGDFVRATAHTSKLDFQDSVNNAFNHITTDFPILYCPGNHCLGLDSLTDFALAPTHTELKTWISDRFYDRLPQNYKDATVRGTAPDATYYYTDVPNTNVRVIALNQFEYPLIDGTPFGRPIKYSGAAIYQSGTSNIIAGFNVYYSQAQLNFLVNALNTMSNDQTAIILTHIPINSLTDNNGDLNALGNSNIALRQILKSFKDRTNITVNVDAIDEIGAFNINTTFNTRTTSKIVIHEGHIHNSIYYLLEDTGIYVIRNRAIGNVSPFTGIDGDSVSSFGADIMSLNEDKNEMSILKYGASRTIKETGIPIGTDEHGYMKVKNPLKL